MIDNLLNLNGLIFSTKPENKDAVYVQIGNDVVELSKVDVVKLLSYLRSVTKPTLIPGGKYER